MISSSTYTEVYEILSCMDKITVMKIPIEILNTIKENRDLNYKTKIDKSDIFNFDNISEESVDLLAWIDVNYWFSKEEREKLIEECEEEKRKKYNPTDIFKDNNKSKELGQKNKFISTNENIVSNANMIEIKENIFQKVIRKIKMIFIKND